MSKVSSIPTDPKVIELTEYNSERSCKGCSERAEFYVIVTDEMISERLNRECPTDEWPVNQFLCRGCFADAERVGSWEELVED